MMRKGKFGQRTLNPNLCVDSVDFCGGHLLQIFALHIPFTQLISSSPQSLSAGFLWLAKIPKHIPSWGEGFLLLQATSSLKPFQVNVPGLCHCDMDEHNCNCWSLFSSQRWCFVSEDSFLLSLTSKRNDQLPLTCLLFVFEVEGTLRNLLRRV